MNRPNLKQRLQEQSLGLCWLASKLTGMQVLRPVARSMALHLLACLSSLSPQPTSNTCSLRSQQGLANTTPAQPRECCLKSLASSSHHAAAPAAARLRSGGMSAAPTSGSAHTAVHASPSL